MTKDIPAPQDSEEVVSFKKSDRMNYGVVGYDGNELMAVISGYDLNIAFNMKLINSLADAEAYANAMADVFYQALMEQLIAEKADFVNPDTAAKPIL
jgi:hypothetical protein